MREKDLIEKLKNTIEEIKKADVLEKECPFCKGTGVMKFDFRMKNRKHYREAIKEAVYVLHDSGFSYRNIAEILGFNSTNSPYDIVKKRERVSS